MDITLTTELFWLVATVTMTALFWVPYIVDRMAQHSVLQALWDPLGVTDTTSAWAIRMRRAHQNAIENLAVFAPLVLVLHATGISTPATATACVVYFYARAVHFVVFTFKIPVLRVVTFAVGFGAQMVLALTLLGVF